MLKQNDRSSRILYPAKLALDDAHKRAGGTVQWQTMCFAYGRP